METTQVETKKFEELNVQQQQKAIEKHRDINVHYGWADGLITSFLRKAKELGFEDIEFENVQFNLGRGSYFGVDNKVVRLGGTITAEDGSELWIDGSVENRHKSKKTGYYRSDFPVEEWSYGIPDLHNYFEIPESHDAELTRIDDKLIEGQDLTDEELEYISKKFDLGCNVSEYMEHKTYKLCRLCEEYYDLCSEEYTYLMSNEAVADTLRLNDYDFWIRETEGVTIW
jgi:hypothetical protein